MLRARSSVGQSCRLIIGRSLVRVQPGPCVEPLQTRGFRIYRKAMRRGEDEKVALAALVEGSAPITDVDHCIGARLAD